MNLTEQAGWEELTHTTVEVDRIRRWGEIYVIWLEGLQARYSQNAWEDAHHAWTEFNQILHKPPWKVTQTDVEQYRKLLGERGRQASTIRIRLMNLSRFYDFFVQSGIEKELTERENPFVQVEWPKVRSYEKPTYLRPADERKFLRTIQRDPSAIGKRDYALFLTLLSTGRAASEVRKLQWQDLGFDGDLGWVQRRDSGDPYPLAGSTWKAIQDWLMASGRLEKMTEEDYVFTPSKDPLIYEAGNREEDWTGNRPLSQDEVHYLLKLYTGWAGLNTKMVTCHTLRNTAALRLLERGESVQSILASTGRNNAIETRKYLKKLVQNGVAVGHSRKRLIHMSETIPSRKPGRAEPGNRRALWHGFYANSLPEMDTLEEWGIHLEGIEREIMMKRMALLRMAYFFRESNSLDEAIFQLDLIGKAAVRVVNMIYKTYYTQPKDQRQQLNRL